MDKYLRNSLKTIAVSQPPPPDGKVRLLKAAAEPASKGFIRRFLNILFPGPHPLENSTFERTASVEYFDSTMIWVFRSGMVNLRFLF